MDTPAGRVPVVATRLTLADRLGTWRVRWGIGRLQYRVRPGLYAVGRPTPESPVFVSANYKLSFDCLRSSLNGLSGWILVLETYGINVWCAAGKGTFGTLELASRIHETQLEKVVSHKKVVVPQLGATGVSGYRVKFYSGFNVIFGPVRAADIPAFLDASMNATEDMRTVRFGILDRATLIPVEAVMAGKFLLLTMAAFLALSGFHPGGYDAARIVSVGLPSIALIAAAWIAGSVLAPLLLPWLPGRAFSLKGATAGIITIVVGAAVVLLVPSWSLNWATILAWVLIIPAVASFIAMNFTGASTYTSLSGVRKEILASVPVQAVVAVVGLGFWITGRFI